MSGNFVVLPPFTNCVNQPRFEPWRYLMFMQHRKRASRLAGPIVVVVV